MNRQEKPQEAGMDIRKKGLLIDAAIYAAAFVISSAFFMRISHPLVATAVFTAVCTVLIFIGSVVFADVSVYDPYWSVAPPVMLLLNMIRYRLWNVNAWVLLAVVCIWAVRLTANWYAAYPGLGHEDWRYAKYRKKYPPFEFHLISFVGLHFVPTVAVYAGMISALLAVREERFVPLSAAGIAVMLAAVYLEYVSDRDIHRFLRDHPGERKTCNISVWHYSRHPNYLGEMSFWTGMFIYFAALRPDSWYLGLGFLSIIALFLFVSIPMMEKHNMERRADYGEYRASTPMLIPLPGRVRPEKE